MNDEPVGSLAEEAAKLFGALTNSQQDGTTDAPSSHRCPHSWCPVCHITEYVQGNPELMRQLTDSATVFLASVRDVLDQFAGEEDRE